MTINLREPFKPLAMQDLKVWAEALAGKNPTFEKDVPYCGNWRTRQRDGRRVPVLVRLDAEGHPIGRVGDGPWVEADASWCESVLSWALKDPVSEDDVHHLNVHGRWPDEHADPARRENAPLDQVCLEMIEEIMHEMQAYLQSIGGSLTTTEQSHKFGNYADRLLEISKEAESTRTSEKEPHLRAGRSIDATWKPVLENCAAALKWARDVIGKFLQAERARLVTQAAEKVARGEDVRPDDLKVTAGTRGRPVSLRSYQTVEVTDWATLFRFYWQDNRFQNDEAVQKRLLVLAKADLQAEKRVPGAALKTVTNAV